MAQVATYYSYGLLTGRASTLDEFRTELKKYSRDQIVYLCSAMNVLLRSWFRGAPDNANHEALVRMLLDEATAYQLLMRSAGQETYFVFHREQLLFVAKEAILSCPAAGLNPLNQPRGAMTRLFLMANDHLYAARPETTDYEKKLLNLLTNLVPSIEYSAPHAFRNAIARSHLMYGRFANELKNEADYINVGEKFRELVGLTPDEFMGLCFGLLSKYMKSTIQSFAASPECLFIADAYFQQTAIGAEQIHKFKKELSATSDELKAAFEKKMAGPSDFTSFRAKPLYPSGDRMFCIDPGFLAEKLETAPFWRTLLSMDDKGRDALLRFSGKVFERYTNWLLAESVGRDNKHNMVVASPQYESDGSEVCDALMLCGSDAVFIEYKGAFFTAASKYGRSPEKLLQEIEDKLIRNPEGKRKGIEQLADAIRRTCRKAEPERVRGVDLANIKRIFPLLVLRDGIGDAPMMNAFLLNRFDAISTLSSKTVEPKILTPLFCMAADALEYISGFLKDASLSDILDARYRANKGMGAPFLAVDNDVLDPLGEKRNTVLENAFHSFVEPMVKALFPEEFEKQGLPQQP